MLNMPNRNLPEISADNIKNYLADNHLILGDFRFDA